MSLAHVIVPRGEIEVLLNDVVIEAIEPPHSICGDELLRIGIGADHV